MGRSVLLGRRRLKRAAAAGLVAMARRGAALKLELGELAAPGEKPL